MPSRPRGGRFVFWPFSPPCATASSTSSVRSPIERRRSANASCRCTPAYAKTLTSVPSRGSRCGITPPGSLSGPAPLARVGAAGTARAGSQSSTRRRPTSRAFRQLAPDRSLPVSSHLGRLVETELPRRQGMPIAPAAADDPIATARAALEGVRLSIDELSEVLARPKFTKWSAAGRGEACAAAFAAAANGTPIRSWCRRLAIPRTSTSSRSRSTHADAILSVDRHPRGSRRCRRLDSAAVPRAPRPSRGVTRSSGSERTSGWNPSPLPLRPSSRRSSC
jgi:hypothetical protein